MRAYRTYVSLSPRLMEFVDQYRAAHHLRFRADVLEVALRMLYEREHRRPFPAIDVGTYVAVTEEDGR